MSSFPTGVVVVTTLNGAGEPRGLTCSSLASVTLTPPTLLVCVKNGSETLEALCAYGRFGVNLLDARARRAAEVFSGPFADRFAEVGWRLSGQHRLPHLVSDAFAFAACEVAGTLEVGDHTVVFGRVMDVLQDSGVPLLYGLRQFSSWGVTGLAA